MILSRASEYAIRLIFYLYERQPLPRYVRIKDVANELEVSYNQLAKVAHILISKEILMSNTGPTGGIDLGRKADDLTLFEIINNFGDGEIFDRCVLGLKECSNENPCPIHAVWGNTRGEMKDIFFQKTLSELKAEAVLPILKGRE
jgi:Rrf2 family iron-sulfur cluster assembly transcriptional regulator